MPVRQSEEEKRQQKLDAHKKAIQDFVDKAAAFQRVFDGKDGEVVLDYLKRQTAGFDKDPCQHAFNAGKSRIVRIIEEMKDEKEYKKHVEYLKGLGNDGSSDNI